jgi:phage-related protein
MSNGEEWAVEFYTDDNDHDLVAEFIRGLDSDTQSNIRAAIQYLRIYNVQAHEPHVKQIEGKLWELRITSNKNAYRIFYFMQTGRKIILLHGFQKKKQKTPKKEIETAQRRLASQSSRKE